MVCKYCQREIADQSRFCKYCGSILSDNPAYANVQNATSAYYPPYTQGISPNEPPKKKKSKVKKLLLILLVTVLILTIIGCVLVLIFFPPDDMYYLAESKSTYYQEDETDEYRYWYNVNGFETGSSSEYRDFEVEFDEGGRVSIISYKYNDSDEDKEYEFDYSETSSGSSGNTGDPANETYFEAEYNNQNKLVSFARFEDKQETLRYNMSYNFFGHRVYEEKISYDSEDDVTFKYIKNYDHKGDIVSSESYCEDVLLSSNEYKNGELIKSSSAEDYDIEDGEVFITSYTKATYDEDGFPTEINYYDENDEVIGYMETIENSDSVFEIKYYEDDEFTGRIYCELDGDRNIIKQKNYDEDDELTYYYTAKYDGDGNCIKYEAFGADGESYGYETMKYDEHGNCIEEKEYDEEGELESLTEYTYKKKKLFYW